MNNEFLIYLTTFLKFWFVSRFINDVEVTEETGRGVF
jgi:hypothetical protein